MTADERDRWKKVESALRTLDHRLTKIERALEGATGTPGVQGKLKGLEEKVTLIWGKLDRLELKDPNRGKVRG